MTVVPREGHDDRQPDDEHTHQDTVDELGPVEGRSNEFRAMRDSKGGAQIRNSPVQNLVLQDAMPELGKGRWSRCRGTAFGFLFCGGLAHSPALRWLEGRSVQLDRERRILRHCTVAGLSPS